MFGATAELVTENHKELVIWPENQLAIELFFCACHCWRVHPMTGQIMSWDRPQLAVEMDFHPHITPENKKDIWQKLRIMEAAVIDALSD